MEKIGDAREKVKLYRRAPQPSDMEWGSAAEKIGEVVVRVTIDRRRLKLQTWAVLAMSRGEVGYMPLRHQSRGRTFGLRSTCINLQGGAMLPDRMAWKVSVRLELLCPGSQLGHLCWSRWALTLNLEWITRRMLIQSLGVKWYPLGSNKIYLGDIWWSPLRYIKICFRNVS